MNPETTQQRLFTLREARPEELDRIGDLIRAAYGEYESFYPAERWQSYIQNVGDVRRRLADSELIVAQLADAAIAGSVTFFANGALSGQGEWPAGWAGIVRLAVEPNRRGLGIGRALIDECLRRGRERRIETIALHTTDWMAVARGMYERMGFARATDFDFSPRPGIIGLGYRYDFARELDRRMR